MLPTSRKYLTSIFLLLTMSIILVLTGCTDNKQLKQDLLQAINKQQDVTSYRFQGSMELKGDASLVGQADPLTGILFSFMRESTINFQGVSALEPARMETTLSVTSKGGSPVTIPILIKDSKLYFQVPALNKPDEFMMLPIPSKPASSGGGADSLKNTGQWSAALMQQLFKDVDPAWLKPSKEAAKLADGTTGKSITLDINTKNEQAFADYMSKSVAPGFVEMVKTNGFAASASMDKWSTALEQVKIKAPSSITLTVDSAGFIREQQWNLSFTAGNSTNVNTINWTYHLSDINQNPAFTQDTPAKTKSLEDLLRLVKPNNSAKK